VAGFVITMPQGLTSIELARDEKLAPIGGSAELTGVQEGLPTSLGDRMTTPHHLVLLEETGTIIVANHSGVAITGVSSEVTGASAAIKAPSGRIESGGNIEEGVTGVDVVGKGNVTIEKKTGNINSGGDVINAITGIRQTSGMLGKLLHAPCNMLISRDV